MLHDDVLRQVCDLDAYPEFEALGFDVSFGPGEPLSILAKVDGRWRHLTDFAEPEHNFTADYEPRVLLWERGAGESKLEFETLPENAASNG